MTFITDLYEMFSEVFSLAFQWKCTGVNVHEIENTFPRNTVSKILENQVALNNLLIL